MKVSERDFGFWTLAVGCPSLSQSILICLCQQPKSLKTGDERYPLRAVVVSGLGSQASCLPCDIVLFKIAKDKSPNSWAQSMTHWPETLVISTGNVPWRRLRTANLRSP